MAEATATKPSEVKPVTQPADPSKVTVPPQGKRGRKPVPADETKRDRFVRLAQSRVNTALYAIARLGTLSNRSIYEYTPDDVDKIIGAMLSELQTVRGAFSSTGKSEKKFTL